jgi:hypothetical protein
MLHRLDADVYLAEETVVLTMPLSLPYPIHEASYERAKGEFEYKGESFHLVMQKIENDTLFAVCVKDKQQRKLDNVLTAYANLTNNLPASTKHTLDLLGKLFKDYTSSIFSTQGTLSTWSIEITFAETSFELLHGEFTVDSPPPELI